MGQFFSACWLNLVSSKETQTFLASFWPNLAATIFGVALGIPIALWINRLASKGTQRLATQSQHHRLDHALQVLILAMEENQIILSQYKETLEQDRIKLELGLDLSAWNAISADFSAELTSPSLRRLIAHYFIQIAELKYLNQEYVGFVFGTNASMMGSAGTRELFRNTMTEMCAKLFNQGNDLVISANDLRKSIGTA